MIHFWLADPNLHVIYSLSLVCMTTFTLMR
eukprot:UN21287